MTKIEEHSDWIYELETIKERLGGTITYCTTLDHTGRQSKKIVIEYDVKHKETDGT